MTCGLLPGPRCSPGRACRRRSGPAPGPCSRRSARRRRTGRRSRAGRSSIPWAAACADPVVVVGLAPDHGAEAGDARIAPRLRAGLRRQRQLERARDVVDVDVALRRRPPRRSPSAPRRQPLREVLVERRAHDRERLRHSSFRGRDCSTRPATRRDSTSFLRAVGLALLAEQLLVERQALVVQRVAELVALGASGSRGCARPGTCSIGIWSVTSRP